MSAPDIAVFQIGNRTLYKVSVAGGSKRLVFTAEELATLGTLIHKVLPTHVADVTAAT
ncbi:MAG: hypothetical protein JST91_08630 [Actinobacteria bacterium]|nr:hypothetical protein [Actinomycetota bacterium]